MIPKSAMDMILLEHEDRMTALVAVIERLEAQLQLANAVCESINEFDPHGEYWNQYALDAWRKSKEEG